MSTLETLVMPSPEQLHNLAVRVSVLEGQLNTVMRVLNISPAQSSEFPEDQFDRTDTSMGPIVSANRTQFL